MHYLNETLRSVQASVGHRRGGVLVDVVAAVLGIAGLKEKIKCFRIAHVLQCVEKGLRLTFYAAKILSEQYFYFLAPIL